MADANPPPPTSPPPPGPLRAAAYGLAMGTADAVPGVSGGTVALILGFYRHLLDQIALVLGALRKPTQHWRDALRAMVFLGPLGLGAVTALVLGVKLLVGDKPEVGSDGEALRSMLAEAPGWLLNPGSAPLVYACFFGLVLASINEPWSHRRQGVWWDWLLAAIAAAVVALVVLLPSAAGSTAPPMLVLAGALAISVMLLPGISGSLTLLVIGMYQPVASAVHDRDLISIAWVGSGAVVGVIIAVPLLRRLLDAAHDRTMACLSGLMAGSLIALWPWKTHTFPEAIPLLGPMQPILPSGLPWLEIIMAALGAGVVILTRVLVGRQRHSLETKA